MLIAYLDTNSGIAGDMTLAAFVDAGADLSYITQQIHSLGLPQVSLEMSETQRHCFRALRLDVRHPPEHAHRHLSDIEAMLDRSSLTDRERILAQRLFRKIGTAEAKVHGTTLEEVHFHEVGAIDSIVDIVGTAVAISSLNISRIVASPTPTGCGTIHIAHGEVSVPAPATAELLKGIPIKSSHIQAELTTPTGAAILASLVDGFGPVPDMQIQRIGYGAGHKELREQANLLRVLIGKPLEHDQDEVSVLETNLDDVTGEQLGFAIEQMWKAGALDVYTTAIGMKKNRPAVLLSVICRPESRLSLEDCLFKHTGSLGIRRSLLKRSKLRREIRRVEIPGGEVRVKLAWGRDGASELRFAPEYEDCRRVASDQGLSLEVVYQQAVDAAKNQFTLQSNASRQGEFGSDVAVTSGLPAAASGESSNDHGHDHHSHHHDHGGHHHHH